MRLAKVMTVFPQVPINIDVRTRPDLSTVPEIAKAIKGAEVALGDNGRVLVRYSETQNMCGVMVEGPTQKETEKYCRRIAEVVRTKLG